MVVDEDSRSLSDLEGAAKVALAAAEGVHPLEQLYREPPEGVAATGRRQPSWSLPPWGEEGPRHSVFTLRDRPGLVSEGYFVPEEIETDEVALELNARAEAPGAALASLLEFELFPAPTEEDPAAKEFAASAINPAAKESAADAVNPATEEFAADATNPAAEETTAAAINPAAEETAADPLLLEKFL